jgi:NADH-quinone oxidoreductase subunit A
MLDNYLPILIFIAIGIAIGVVPIIMGFLLAPHRPDSEKNSPFECGFEAFEDTRMRFDVRYYLVAILFIIFDLEIAFLFPWAVVLDSIGMFGFVAMMIFLLRSGLLCRRNDAGRRVTLRSGPLWHYFSRQSPSVGCHDCGGYPV